MRVNSVKKAMIAVLVFVLIICQQMPLTFAEEKASFKDMSLPGDVWACDFDKGDEVVSYYTVSEGVGSSTYRTGVDMRLFDHSYGVGTAFTQNDWANYTVKVEKSGFYVPTVYYATPETGVNFSLEYNDEIVNFNLEPTADYTNAVAQEFDAIYMTEGKTTLKIRWKIGGVTLYKLSFAAAGTGGESLSKTEGSYRTQVLPAKIQAEDFDLGAEGYLSLDGKNNGGKYRKDDGIDIYADSFGGHYISLFGSEFTKYSFTVPATGAYSFAVNSKGSSDVEFYFDTFEKPVKTQVRNVNAFTETHIENIYFEKGEHSITIKPQQELSVDYIKLVSSKEDGLDIKTLIKNDAEEEKEVEKIHPVYKNLYMSPDGTDSGDGSEASPFATLKRVKEEIAKINDDMDGDIIVNIAPGTYKIDETEEFTQEHSGKNGYDVIFRGTSLLEKPVFHGGTEVTGWEKYNDYIWKAPFDGCDDIRNLYINGYMAQRARSKYRYRPTEDYVHPDSSNVNDGVGITEINFPTEFARPEDIELCWQNAWAFQITPVADIERRDGMVYFIMDQPYYNWARSRQAMSQSPGAFRRFHIQNAFELLDEPGEFYYNKDEKMIYYYPFMKEDLLTAETVVGTTELMFSLSGDKENKIKNIIFDNLSIKYGAWNEVNEIGMIVDQADKIVNAPSSKTGSDGRMIPAQLDIRDAEEIQVVNCEFSCLGSSAIAMSDGVSRSKIAGNSIHDISGSGIVIGHWDHNANGNHPNHVNLTQCSDIDVYNNALVRIAYEYKGCIGISVYFEKNINIIHNYLQDTAYSGMSIGWGWGESADFGNIKIKYNYIENPMIPPVLDGGHVYTLGPLKDSELSHNYFKTATGLYGGIYPDSGSAYMEVYNNVVEDGPHWFFGGLYETHDLYVHDNYSNVEKYYDYGVTDGFPGENNVSQATIVKDGNWSDEALKIMVEAGLEENYKRLLTGLEYPSWRTDFVKNAPSESFIVPDASWYEAEDYNDGGEGVGYHWNSKTDNQVYRPGDVVIFHQEDTGDIVVGGTYGGEWLKYDFEIPEDATYEYIMVGGNGQHLSAAPEPYANVYIDDVLVFERAHMQQTENWGLNVENIIGELELKKGKHVLKVEFVDNGFSFDKFQFRDIRTKGLPVTTSPYYDETEFILENPFDDIDEHWAKDSIIEMAHKGVIKGMTETTFAPNGTLTKEQAMLLVLRSAGLGDKDDCNEAVKLGLIANPVNWQEKITREEFSSAMAKAYRLNNGEKAVNGQVSYVDEKDINEAFYDDVMLLSELEVIKGGDDGAFYPKKSLTRAEAATIISRFFVA